MRQSWVNAADLCPDEAAGTLTVNLHHLSNAGSDQLAAKMAFCMSQPCFGGVDRKKPLQINGEGRKQQAAKKKDRWSKALNDARLDFQNSNDRESADFVTVILDSLERPGGMAPAALAGNLDHIKNQVRDLVRHGAMESAASLNYAQVQASYKPNFSPPPHPNNKTGGRPGPGGLALYLPFDKPDDNGVIHDESGAGNDGRVCGAQWVSEGKFGGAYHFSLTNFTDGIVISNSESLNPDCITVAAWVKGADNDGIWHRIMDKDCWHGRTSGLRWFD